jgi:chromosome segregation protein
VLIVTHQKRTMEVAEMMYGVSMGKDGTSRVVAQRLEDPTTRGQPPDEEARSDAELEILVPEPDGVG